jgi:hypothetical protein
MNDQRCPANHWEPGFGPCLCDGTIHTEQTRPRFSKVEQMTFDHPMNDEDGCGYCHDCGAQELWHSKEKVEAIFDWMEGMSRR